MLERGGVEFLKKLREKRGLTQNGAAVFLGISQPSYRHYETKAQGAQLEFLARVREKYGLEWADLGPLIDKEVEKIRSRRQKKP